MILRPAKSPIILLCFPEWASDGDLFSGILFPWKPTRFLLSSTLQIPAELFHCRHFVFIFCSLPPIHTYIWHIADGTTHRTILSMKLSTTCIFSLFSAIWTFHLSASPLRCEMAVLCFLSLFHIFLSCLSFWNSSRIYFSSNACSYHYFILYMWIMCYSIWYTNLTMLISPSKLNITPPPPPISLHLKVVIQFSSVRDIILFHT